nr:helix-turn-helix domain-containing protein [Streptomyces sp. L2]
MDHFAQWGFHASSPARIAKSVGVTQGGLLHHFRGQEDLLAYRPSTVRGAATARTAPTARRAPVWARVHQTPAAASASAATPSRSHRTPRRPAVTRGTRTQPRSARSKARAVRTAVRSAAGGPGRGAGPAGRVGGLTAGVLPDRRSRSSCAASRPGLTRRRPAGRRSRRGSPPCGRRRGPR